MAQIKRPTNRATLFIIGHLLRVIAIPFVMVVSSLNDQQKLMPLSVAYKSAVRISSAPPAIIKGLATMANPFVWEMMTDLLREFRLRHDLAFRHAMKSSLFLVNQF
jgi:hypothetical protein